MHQPVWGGGGGCGAERVTEETVSSAWLYWNSEPLAAEARQDMRLVSTLKAWLLTRFPSKEHQTFISCKCLPPSVSLWSVLPCSGSPSSMPCWTGSFAKDKATLYLTYITPICLQKYWFSQCWGNFQLRLCLFPSWQRGPTTVHSTWDSFLKGESHTAYSAVGSPAYFQELHSLKSSFSLLMHVCGREERKRCGGKGDKQETSHLSNVGGHFLLFPPFPRPAVKSRVSPAMPAASATEECAAIITWNGWNHLAGPTGEEVCEFIWNKSPKNLYEFAFFFPLGVPPLFTLQLSFPSHRISLSFWCALNPPCCPPKVSGDFLFSSEYLTKEEKWNICVKWNCQIKEEKWIFKCCILWAMSLSRAAFLSALFFGSVCMYFWLITMHTCTCTYEYVWEWEPGST